MVMNLHSAFSIDIFKCTLKVSDLWVRSDKAPLAGAISMKSDEQKYLVASPQACSLREAEKEITVHKGAR